MQTIRSFTAAILTAYIVLVLALSSVGQSPEGLLAQHGTRLEDLARRIDGVERMELPSRLARIETKLDSISSLINAALLAMAGLLGETAVRLARQRRSEKKEQVE